MDNSEKGIIAESLAENFFIEKGFDVVEKNYRYKRAEIDLIVKKSDLMVFVEVKFRSSTMYGHPEEFVSHNQIDKIIGAADHYISESNWLHQIRFDIVAIDRNYKIEHFKDAFY